MADMYSEGYLEVLLDLARWGNAFPESPSKNHFGTARIEVTFPENFIRVELLEDGIKVHDLVPNGKIESK